MADEPKKHEDQDKPQDGPTFDEVVRKMLNTPPKPKKAVKQGPANSPRSGKAGKRRATS